MTDPWGGLTDVVLAASCLGGILAIGRDRPAASLGLAVVGAAAALGAAEFLGMPSLKGPHDAATALAGSFGVPLLGVAVVAVAVPTLRVLPLGIALLVAAVLLGQGPRYASIVGGWSLLLAILAGVRWRREEPVRGGLAIGGAVGAIVAGLGVAGEGDWLGLSRLGWFHVAFAGAMAAFGAALRR